MKKLLIFIFTILVSLSSFSQKGKWKKAQKANSIEAYQAFIEKYPGSEFTDAAKSNIVELNFNTAKRVNTIKSYEEFLSSYPNSKMDNEVKASIMNLEFNKAETINSIDLYNDFIQKYPKEDLTSIIREKLMILQYNNAKSENTIESYENFLEIYSAGELSDKVRKKLQNIEYENAKVKNTIVAYELFIRKYPMGRYSLQAKKELEELHYYELISGNNLQKCEEFLNKYPDSKYTTIVSQRVINLNLGSEIVIKLISHEADQELTKILSLCGVVSSAESLESLYDCLEQYPEIKQNSRPHIHYVLISAIESDDEEQFIRTNEKVNNLIDHYTFAEGYSIEYSYEAALCRELSIKIIRPFLKNTLEDLYNTSIDAGVAMLNGNSNGQKIMMDCIVASKQLEPMARAMEKRTALDIKERQMSKCAKYYYISILDKVLSGNYEPTHEWNLGSKAAFNYNEKLKEKEEEQKEHEKEIYQILKNSQYKENNKIIKDYIKAILAKHN